MCVVPTRRTRAFTGQVASSRAKDRACPAFLSHITRGLLICFSSAVPTNSYQTLSFQQPSSPVSALISSPHLMLSTGRTQPGCLFPTSRLLGSPAPQLYVPLTKLLHPAFLIPLLKEGVLSSPSNKMGRRRLLYSINH